MQQNTLSNFIESSYKPWALANLKSAELSIQSVQRAFKESLNNPLISFDIKTIEHWRTTKLRSGIKPSTINRLVNALRAILTKAVEWEAIPEHPLQKLKQLKVDEATKARFLQADEESRLFNVLLQRDKELIESRERANEHRRKRGYDLLPSLTGFHYGDRLTPLVILSLKTGLRRGELFDAKWEGIDFENQVLTVHGENAKSSKTRHIPLSPIAFETLIRWRQQSSSKFGRIFPSDTGGRLNNVNTAWRNLLKRASITQFRWHDMRHDFASKLVTKGVPLNTVRELCGHADLNTTLRYAHLAPDHKSSAIALLG
ncbi:tyrosine-type recombinase/integrase [Teredinibacter waterburyi]|uniref:tyrosine-type recombinase/integrase n=1 Tax=Teredinibacter waterburyi TaxID=1500538 RepID=UPI00165F6FDF|nr:site-specific integrase [Teredinibacter waterburyi]